MAKPGMDKSMGNRECEWIRPRLPLLVDKGDGTGRPAGHGEGGDLSVRDIRHIERHLATCPVCRTHRASMDRALGALAIAAAEVPIVADASSLWPLLEGKIASGEARVRPVSLKHPHASVVQSGRSTAELDDVYALRNAWSHDTVREAMSGPNHRRSTSVRRVNLVFLGGVAAAVVVGLFELSQVRRQWMRAEAIIEANAIPVALPENLPASVVEAPRDNSNSERDRGDTNVSNQLAEADTPRPAESSAPTVDAVASPRIAHPTRFGFDLERGIPMPPDSRDSKPVY